MNAKIILRRLGDLNLGLVMLRVLSFIPEICSEAGQDER